MTDLNKLTEIGTHILNRHEIKDETIRQGKRAEGFIDRMIDRIQKESPKKEDNMENLDYLCLAENLYKEMLLEDDGSHYLWRLRLGQIIKYLETLKKQQKPQPTSEISLIVGESIEISGVDVHVVDNHPFNDFCRCVYADYESHLHLIDLDQEYLKAMKKRMHADAPIDRGSVDPHRGERS